MDCAPGVRETNPVSVCLVTGSNLPRFCIVPGSKTDCSTQCTSDTDCAGDVGCDLVSIEDCTDQTAPTTGSCLIL